MVKLLKSPNSDFVRIRVKIGVVIKPMLFVTILHTINHMPDLMTIDEYLSFTKVIYTLSIYFKNSCLRLRKFKFDEILS